MAHIVITVNTDNAAFDYHFSDELNQVLSQVADKVALRSGGSLYDSNGNQVGEVTVSDGE